MKPLDPGFKQFQESLFKNSADRLVKFLSMSGTPSKVIASEIDLLVRRAEILYAEELAIVRAENARETQLAAWHLCKLCGGEIHEKADQKLCPSCETDAVADNLTLHAQFPELDQIGKDIQEEDDDPDE